MVYAKSERRKNKRNFFSSVFEYIWDWLVAVVPTSIFTVLLLRFVVGLVMVIVCKPEGIAEQIVKRVIAIEGGVTFIAHIKSNPQKF